MSAEADLPPGQRNLYDARRVSPAEQDERRDRDDRRPDKTYYEDIIKIPGFGHKPERCQNYRAVGFCRNGHPKLGQSSCGTRYCPDHYGDWLEDGVVQDVARLAAFRYAADGWGKRLLHVVLSPEQDRRWSARRVWETRSDAYEVAEAVGVRGGRIFVHPYRTSERADAMFETAVEHGDHDPDDGKWKMLRGAAEDWEEMLGYVEPAPHYHGLVACEDFDPDGAPEGWVAKNIRSLPRFDYRDVEAYRPMARVAWYLRTHSGVQDGRHSVSWFGDVHPAAFDPEEELPAAVWSKIQEMAEKALASGRGGAALATEPERCEHEECEAIVEPIEKLDEFADDEEWLASIEPAQRAQMRGLRLWVIEDGDRPPPGCRGSEESLLRWLERKGGEVVLAGSSSSSSASTAQGRL